MTQKAKTTPAQTESADDLVNHAKKISDAPKVDETTVEPTNNDANLESAEKIEAEQIAANESELKEMEALRTKTLLNLGFTHEGGVFSNTKLQVTIQEGEIFGMSEEAFSNEAEQLHKNVIATQFTERSAQLQSLGLTANDEFATFSNGKGVVVPYDDVVLMNSTQWDENIASLQNTPSLEEEAQYPVYPKDDPFQAKETHAKRLAKFGEGYVVVSRGTMQTVFSKTTWEQMRGDSLWKVAEPMPKEVLQNKLSKK